ncbi:hypothetical protein FDECE_7558 [Fusarium decemcellulare]|nr:hypothetical protein FDECE_7558 [Fusarium decemcellulare]
MLTSKVLTNPTPNTTSASINTMRVIKVQNPDQHEFGSHLGIKPAQNVTEELESLHGSVEAMAYALSNIIILCLFFTMGVLVLAALFTSGKIKISRRGRHAPASDDEYELEGWFGDSNEDERGVFLV